MEKSTSDNKPYNSDLDAAIQAMRKKAAPVQTPEAKESEQDRFVRAVRKWSSMTEEEKQRVLEEDDRRQKEILKKMHLDDPGLRPEEAVRCQRELTALAALQDVIFHLPSTEREMKALESLREHTSIYDQLKPELSEYYRNVFALVDFYRRNNESLMPVQKTGISKEEFLEELKKPEYADKKISDLYRDVNGNTVENPLEADTPIRRIIEAIKGRKEKRKRIRQTEIKSDLACVPNCLLVNELAELIDAGRTWLRPLPGLKTPHQTQVDVSWLAQEDNVEVTGKFTEADRHVFNALCVPFDNLDFDQQATLSVNKIYQLMTGNDFVAITPQQEAEVCNALHRLQNIYIRADATVEMKHRKKAPFKIDGRMLSVVDTVELNGTLYFSLGYPPLLKYSKITDQIVRYDRALLHVLECTQDEQGNWIFGKPVQTNERRRTINAYFLRRIAIMNNGIRRANEKYSRESARRNRLAKKTPGREAASPGYDWQPALQRIVLDEEFFARFGIVTASDKSKARAYIRDKLLPFYEAMGFIRGSSLITAGKSFRAVTIFPTETPLKITN